MRTFICPVFWRGFSGRDDGWRRGWAELAASRGVGPSELPPRRTGGWVEGRRRQREAEVTESSMDEIGLGAFELHSLATLGLLAFQNLDLPQGTRKNGAPSAGLRWHL